MSSNKPPEEGNTPVGGSLWQILHDDGKSGDGAPAPASEALAAPPRAPRPAASPETPSSTEAAADSANATPLIQRILSAPEELGDDFEYRSEPVAESPDFDRALLNFYRDTGVAVNCRNHPEQSATGGQCPMCTAYYCQSCMVVRRGRYLCRDCADATYVPTADEVLQAQERGMETPETEVLPEAFPEFQVGAEIFGLEGTPASPLKRLIALLIDFMLLRGLELGLLFVLSLMFDGTGFKLFTLFTPSETESVAQKIFEAALLFRPPVPWLIVFAVTDYLYFFLSLAMANRTIGMSWTGCRIVTEWGDYVSFSAVALRTLVFMVCLGVPALVLGWLFPAFRGPHDYAAGTLVINYAGVKRVDVYETVQIKL